MANTNVQIEIEDWLRSNWLPRVYGQRFRRERLRLNAGGVFDFDAVSDDDKIIVNISTSSALTAKGKLGVGKMHKIHSDIMFLMMVNCDKKIILLNEKDMYDQCVKEKEAGRLPNEIYFELAELPDDLRTKLNAARLEASKEVTPVK